MNKKFEYYVLPNGKEPLTEWIESTKDIKTRARIKARLAQVLSGTLGDHKYLQDEVSELKLDFGAGYRIYYSELDDIILLLLSGGNKSTQKRDVKKAINYLKDYKERT
jgi:putative addiction module killer protein